ncbi:MAG: thioredoxin domain-containing protein [Candidatus Woesearchaeota archaeon]
MKKILIFSFISMFILSACASRPGEFDAFAQCTNEAGLVMYGTEWCPHCQNQKGLFGRSFRLVNYVDCDRDRRTCMEEGITGFPTWKFDGQSYSGVQQLTFLSDLTGCPLFEEELA